MSCLDRLADISVDFRQFANEVQALMDSLKLIFVLHGIVLPIIVGMGLVFNVLSLIVLYRKQFSSSPYILLRCLCICDICILSFSIYSDIEPAIRSSGQVASFKEKFQPTCDHLFSSALNGIKMNASFFLTQTNYSSGFGRETLNYSYCGTTQVDHPSVFNVNGSCGELRSDLGVTDFSNNYEGSNADKFKHCKKVYVNLTSSQSVEDTNQMLMMLLMMELKKENNLTKQNRISQTQNSEDFNFNLRLPKLYNENKNKRSQHRYESSTIPPHPQQIIGQQRTNGHLHINSNFISVKDNENIVYEKTDFETNSFNPENHHFQYVQNDSNVSDIERSTGLSPLWSNLFASSTISPPTTSSISSAIPSPNSFPSGVVINSKPIVQATERWISYTLMTLNLGVILTLAIERCLAITFPFKIRTWLTSNKSRLSVLVLLLMTFTLHSPQYIKELILAVTSPKSLQDDFRGEMLQVCTIDIDNA